MLVAKPPSSFSPQLSKSVRLIAKLWWCPLFLFYPTRYFWHDAKTYPIDYERIGAAFSFAYQWDSLVDHIPHSSVHIPGDT
mmetsp:Transcript_17853/g.36932  ORF Transcript_17853/g.36932 Transcript_17853/m.36932 type:complete len:81 (+) Transcript_17853:113-355(+)